MDRIKYFGELVLWDEHALWHHLEVSFVKTAVSNLSFFNNSRKSLNVHLRGPPFSTFSGGIVTISCEHVLIFNGSFPRDYSI